MAFCDAISKPTDGSTHRQARTSTGTVRETWSVSGGPSDSIRSNRSVLPVKYTCLHVWPEFPESIAGHLTEESLERPD